MSNGSRTGTLLAHDLMTAANTPRAWLYVLHGIYGAGRNWASVARRVVEARPGWGAVLVDLREHGASQGFPPPHTVAAAAADVAELESATERPATALLGHSFGGKVALRRALEEPAPRQAWIVDSTPRAAEPSGSAWRMLEVIRGLPDAFETRAAGIAALEAAGIDTRVAQWMATNLERTGEGGLRWRFDLAAVEALLQDFFRSDLWKAVEEPPPGTDLHFVKATESSVLSGESLARLERIADAGPHVHVHYIEGGHWLNADNPDAIVELLTGALPE